MKKRVLFTHYTIYQQEGYLNMDNWTFGITMIVVGMGGTILTLWILSLIMSLMKKLLPYSKEEEK